MTAVTLNLRPILSLSLSDEQFFELCQANRDLKFERNERGEILIASLTGGETGKRNAELGFQLQAWSRQNKLGIVFDSSTGFKLPNGSTRSPDAAWVQRDRWDALTPQQRRKLPPLCPDFIVELLSATDDLEELQAKMREYRSNNMRLGWLIIPKTRQVEVYYPNGEVEILDNPTVVSGEPLLPGFVLDFQTLFED
ncbi:MAG: Uma2 family endonuclease [Oscillatoria sp. SIO1A7]|nr:Uma2 family endonuclease [Oscillatoria sp. SIO1A7]